MHKNTTVLLLGGEGFIGRNLANFFAHSYRCFSVGTQKSLFPQRRDSFIKLDPYKEKIPGKYNIIVHLIDNVVSSEEFFKEEQSLTENILSNTDAHLIVFSSVAVYANPDSPYGVRKRMLEEFYMEYCKEKRMSLTIFRLFNTFGPYQIPFKQGSLIANLLYNFLNKKSTEINDMSAKRDFVYSGDISKFVMCALQNKLVGTFDIASGKIISISETISLLEREILKSSLKIIDKKKKEDLICPPSQVSMALPINIISMREGLGHTLDFYRNNMPIIKKYVD